MKQKPCNGNQLKPHEDHVCHLSKCAYSGYKQPLLSVHPCRLCQGQLLVVKIWRSISRGNIEISSHLYVDHTYLHTWFFTVYG